MEFFEQQSVSFPGSFIDVVPGRRFAEPSKFVTAECSIPMLVEDQAPWVHGFVSLVFNNGHVIRG